jgi:hypothetical protein
LSLIGIIAEGIPNRTLARQIFPFLRPSPERRFISGLDLVGLAFIGKR